MLPARQRFRGDKLFSLVYKKGWKIKSNSFGCYFYKSDNWRVAVVVSKKVAVRATIRNVIRRRVFAVMRQIVKENEFIPGYLIIVANKAASGQSYDNINNELRMVLSKIK